MSEQVTDEQVEVSNEAERQAEAEALQAAMAGYARKEARATTAPADHEPEPHEAVHQPTSEHQPEPPQATTTEPSIAEELAALKAKIKSMEASHGDPDAVRRLYGEVGNLNRQLQQIRDAQPKPEPVKDDLTLALEDAEKIAEEYSEIAGPQVKALKALAAKIAQTPTAPSFDPAEIDSRIAQTATQLRQQEAIEALREEHPDYETVRDTPEFKAWRASKPLEFQHKLDSTWNPLVVSRALTEFKESLKAKQKKQDRLESAVVTPSASARAKPSTLSDEDALWVGYNKGPKRLNQR